MKKIINYNNINIDNNKKKNLNINDISLNLNIFDINIQKIYINNIFNQIKNVDLKFEKLIMREIKNKINSYKHQDIKKDLHDINNIINLNDVIQKLILSNLKCYYCKNDIYLIYENIREKYQWTLDRINNNDAHSNNNTIISCLKCNLERRRKNSEKFLFSKNLKIDKLSI